MDKVYQGCMLVDEKELEAMMNSLGHTMHRTTVNSEPFNDCVKLYVKLLKEKESIQHERAKYEPKTESV